MFETLVLGQPFEPVMAELGRVVEMKTLVLAWRRGL
jgi:hypothetical protein